MQESVIMQTKIAERNSQTKLNPRRIAKLFPFRNSNLITSRVVRTTLVKDSTAEVDVETLTNLQTGAGIE